MPRSQDPGGDRSARDREAARRVREAARLERQRARAGERAAAAAAAAREQPRRRRAAAATGAPGRRARVGAFAARGSGVPLRWLGWGGAALIAVLAVGAALGAGGSEPEPSKAQSTTPEPKPKPSPYGTPTETPLPPATRVVAYTGAPQAKELGILGTMPFEQASDRLDRQAVPYDRKSRPVLRAFDLIATIANAHPGTDGKYRTRQSRGVIAKYLRAARRHDAALILDVQPGTSNFVDETKAHGRWLREPDVHLALDPEWRMRPGVRPGSEIGHVSHGEITATLKYVANVVRKYKLPPKLVLVHRFTDGMITNLPAVKVPKEVVGVISIDGVGTRALKEDTYDRIAPNLPKPWLPGFKLFYEEDAKAGGLMSGKQVMALQPRPHVVLYE